MKTNIIISNQNVPSLPPEEGANDETINEVKEGLIGHKTPQEALDEVKEGLIGNKTPQEALDEVIQEFGGRLSNDEIRNLFN
ncbi:hypothetical protein NIES4074_12100 [Cylindrospermum sp. NIES-4074]|nr:hypothetical protein NIES4074_12100 [Cylindrospermum sp. NIES-4074]